MSSQIEIVNMALTHIGQSSVASIDDNSDNAVKARVLWDNCRDTVLRATTWSFATIIQELNKYTDISVAGWENVYAYPPKCLFLRKLTAEPQTGLIFDAPSLGYNVPTQQEDEEYRVMFSPEKNLKIIVTNIDPAYVEYTYQVTDTTVWDEVATLALSYKLASQLANYLCGDKEEANRMYQLYQSTISDAMMHSKNESNLKRVQRSHFVDGR